MNYLQLFAKAFRSFETSLLVNNSFSGKLFSSLISFDESFKVTAVSFFIPDFNISELQIRQFYV